MGAADLSWRRCANGAVAKVIGVGRAVGLPRRGTVTDDQVDAVDSCRPALDR